MANLGYIQLVRHCNQNCGFCSNPETPYFHDLDQVRAIVDDFVARDYFGVIMTGGEPTLSPHLTESVRYARDKGLHVRMITNGQKMADRDYTLGLWRAGLQHVHISVHSSRHKVEDFLTGTPGSLAWAEAALAHMGETDIVVNVNTVINRYNSDHLDETIAWFIARYPHVRHFVWNNLDPSLGRATSHGYFTPRLADLEIALQRAMRLLDESGRTFRVERVPLCYMSGFEHCSTETRKIVKEEERIVHFLDAKGMVRQTEWGHLYAECCEACRLRPICGGLYDRGEAYDPAELAPVFADPRPIVERIVKDLQSDPSWRPERFKEVRTHAPHQGQTREEHLHNEPVGDHLLAPKIKRGGALDPSSDWSGRDEAVTGVAREDAPA